MNTLDTILIMVWIIAITGVIMYYFPFSKNKQHKHA